MANKRETFKDIEEGGRKWRIGKWDARLAQYWVNKLVMSGGRVSEHSSPEEIQAVVAQNIASLGKPDYFDFQKDCLKVCAELQEMANGQVSPVPVLRIDGSWNVEGLDYDMKTVMALTMTAFTFSVQDPFFDESESGESSR
jgi:hypothetical protein